MSCGVRARGGTPPTSPAHQEARAAVAHADLRSGTGAGRGPRCPWPPCCIALSSLCPAVSTSHSADRCLPAWAHGAQWRLEARAEALTHSASSRPRPWALELTPISGSCWDARAPPPRSPTVRAAGRWLTHRPRAQWVSLLAPTPSLAWGTQMALWGQQGSWHLSAMSGRVDRNTCALEEFRPWLDTVSVTRNWS